MRNSAAVISKHVNMLAYQLPRRPCRVLMVMVGPVNNCNLSLIVNIKIAYHCHLSRYILQTRAKLLVFTGTLLVANVTPNLSRALDTVRLIGLWSQEDASPRLITAAFNGVVHTALLMVDQAVVVGQHQS